MRQYWRGPLIIAQGDGTALTNSTTETSILPAAAKYTLGASEIKDVGQALHVTAQGRISNVVTTPGTLAFNVKAGSTIISASGALNLNVVAKTNVSWWLDWLLVCRAVGSAGNFMHVGRWVSESVVGSAANTAGGSGMLLLPVSAPAVGSNVDLTTSQVIDLTATFSVANASNSIQLHNFLIELVN